jgi:peptidyl-prolyl cis-trans isomerase B (cyclophilin B)
MNSIRSHALWVLPCAVLVLTVLFLADNSSGFFENARHRTFSKEEIQKMEQTTATIETKFGDITLKFFPEVAPNHVNSFIQLAKDGFYDGTTFHRVVPGFVIQGGDPNTKSDDRSRHGMGGPGFTLKAEFSKLPHKRGTLSMARAAHPDSAGSQFFICVADAPFLDGEYTVFGEVVEGMDVVDKIVSQPKDQRDNPIERVEMKVKIAEPDDNS